MSQEQLSYREFWRLYLACRRTDVSGWGPEDLRSFLVKCFEEECPPLAELVAGLSREGMRGLYGHIQHRQASEGKIEGQGTRPPGAGGHFCGR